MDGGRNRGRNREEDCFFLGREEEGRNVSPGPAGVPSNWEGEKREQAGEEWCNVERRN